MCSRCSSINRCIFIVCCLMCVYGLFLAMFFVKRFMFGNFRLPFAETCNKKPNFGRRREIYDFGIRTFLSFVEMSGGQRKNVARICLIPRVQNAIAALASESRSDSRLDAWKSMQKCNQFIFPKQSQAQRLVCGMKMTWSECKSFTETHKFRGDKLFLSKFHFSECATRHGGLEHDPNELLMSN